LAIFEAGISKLNEMDILASIIRPTIGVLTSIGSAHDEGFKDKEQKIAEKFKLLKVSEKIIVTGLHKEAIQSLNSTNITFVSAFKDADLEMRTEDKDLFLRSKTKEYRFSISFSDQASLSNASTCVAVMLALGCTEKEISQGLLKLQPVALRLEIKNGISNCLIINDYYNSDLDSLKIALNYLQQQNRRLKKIIVVSDIEQSGMTSELLYKHMADLFSQNKIDLVIGIGKEISNHNHFFEANSLFFESTPQFIQAFKQISYQFSDAGILLKGARSFGFESISRLLQLKSHDTVFEVDLNKLINNVNYYRSLLSPNLKIMGMVKAMGYGSGSTEIARTLQHIGVNYLAVAYADEGVELRESRIHLPIMVMNPEEDAFEDIINYQLEPEIYSFKVLNAFIEKLDAMGVSEPYPVHIKMDTGMHRLGFEEHEIEKLVMVLKNTAQLHVSSVFSHLVGTDNSDLDDFTKEQIRIFEKAFTHIEKTLGYTVTKHICNSAGISRFKEAHYDMVRLGIGMYGIGVNKTEQQKLENVGTLKTKISQIKEAAAGKTVGYNRNGKLVKDTRVATIPIGYADGFSRLLGNGRHGVYIRNTFCEVIGNVCMDMCMIDVTSLSCKEGDEVIIFENTDQIYHLARALNSIPYEVLTNVSGRVKRVYVHE
jgi:alanine racemase